MKPDVFQYQFEQNLERYFDNLELMRMHSITSYAAWGVKKDMAAWSNRRLDAHFYDQMYIDSTDWLMGLWNDLRERNVPKTNPVRVTLQSKTDWNV